MMKKNKKDEFIEDIEKEVSADLFEEPESELVLKNRIETLENRVKMLQAEMINFRRRKEEEVLTKLNYAKEDIVLDILPICDNFERALQLQEENNPAIEKYLNGFQILYVQLKEVLKKYGVEEIPALGLAFDENIHDAVLVGQDTNKEEGVVLEVFTKGYRLKDKVIRHASVKVNKLN